MTLAARLTMLVAGALLLSLLVGGLLIVAAASHWLQSEIDTNARVARELVEQRLAEAAEEAESPERLTELLRSLETGYHLKAEFISDQGAAAERAPGAKLPAQLRLLGVHPVVQDIPVSLRGLPSGHVELLVDPEPELASVWRAIELGVATIVVFSTSTLILVGFGLTRSLRPLGDLAAALSQVGCGDYSPRVTTGGPKEIAILRLRFNGMADQLQTVQARARSLDAQMLVVQERERREMARDLHDELGPCLLAASLDVSALIRLNRSDGPDAVQDCAVSLAAVLAQMQNLVRQMINRLHLTAADSVEFSQELDALVAFWRDRCPEMEWQINCPRWRHAPSPQTVLTLLRVSQEALANAVRHSSARRIQISCVEDGPDLVLAVADDGVGFKEPMKQGLGLVGMRERLGEIGGVLEFDSRPGRGTTVTARVSSLPGSTLDEAGLP